MALLMIALAASAAGGRAAPDITMSIHGTGLATDDRGQPSYTANQVHSLLSSIEFRLRDLSNTVRRDHQTDRIDSRIDMIFSKLSYLEVSNGLWFDKFQQTVTEQCGPNHMTRRLDKAQQQLEITLEHMETTLQTVQNHQKDLEKEIKKMADRQTDLSADIQSMRKDMSSEFDKHNSSQNDFKKQLQETVSNLSQQQSKITDRSLTTCSCNQNDDPSLIPDTTTTNKLATTVNIMYNGLKERSENINNLLKELAESTDKCQRKLKSDRHDMISEFLDSFLEAAISEIAAVQKKSENELEAKFKEHLQLLVDGQNLFMDNCHRLQSNERQIENDMVLILERILDHIDNRSSSDTTTLEQISKALKTQGDREEKWFTELSELGKTQSDQVARTVAYSTNQVMKLHQEVTAMSNALMIASLNGSGNTTATTETNKNYTSNYGGNNPFTSKTNKFRATTGKPTTTTATTTTSHQDKSNADDRSPLYD